MASRSKTTQDKKPSADRKFAARRKGDPSVLSRRPKSKAEQAQPLSIWEKLVQWGGQCKGLPSDLARNHDHYLHGLPRK
jgi:hypothetical protein